MLILAGLVLALLLVLAFRALFGSAGAGAGDRQPFRYPVDAVAMRRAEAQPELELAGRVTAGRKVAVVAPFDGRVESVAVSVGREVAAGDVLLRLDRRLIELSLNEARRTLDNAELEIEKSDRRRAYLKERLVIEEDALARASRVKERAMQLFERKLITVIDFENYVAAVDSARLQILELNRELGQLQLDRRSLVNDRDTLRAQVADLGRNLDAAELVATVDGVVLDVQATPGGHVASGVELVSVAPREVMEVEIPWPSAAGNGDRVSAWALFPEGALAVEIAEVGSVVVAGQASPTATLIGRGPLARRAVVGGFVPIRLRLPAVADAFLVPSRALYPGDRVFRIQGEPASLVGVPVAVSGRVYDQAGDPHWIVRAEALDDGDQVLASRLAAASDGLPVEVANLIEVETARLTVEPTAAAVALDAASGGSGATDPQWR